MAQDGRVPRRVIQAELGRFDDGEVPPFDDGAGALAVHAAEGGRVRPGTNMLGLRGHNHSARCLVDEQQARALRHHVDLKDNVPPFGGGVGVADEQPACACA